MDDILRQIAAFQDKHEIEDGTFGLKAVNDPGLVFDLRAGRKLRRKTRRRILEFMDTYKPAKRRA